MTPQIPIKVFGTPCGGTQFAYRVLRALGYDVGHEVLERDGIVCGFQALGLRAHRRRWKNVDADTVPHPDTVTARIEAHLIRHPLEVAETLWRYVDRAQVDVRRAGIAHPSLDKTTEALRWWVRTHVALAAKVPTPYRIRLEEGRHTEQDWERFLGALMAQSAFPPSLPVYPAETPAEALREAERGRYSKLHRKHRLSWEDWDRRDPEMADAARKLLLRFDMSIEPTSLP